MLSLLFAHPVFDFVVGDALAGFAADDDADLAGCRVELDTLAARVLGGAYGASKFGPAETIAAARRKAGRLRHGIFPDAIAFCAACFISSNVRPSGRAV